MIGCQGWSYPDWITAPGAGYVFYPEGTRTHDMLGLYSKIFDTVEVDSTFYAIPTESTFEGWYERSEQGFLFSLKLPREITHEGRLGSRTFGACDSFFERALTLKEKLGVILIQLPPAFQAEKENAKLLREFVKRLPDGIRFSVEFRDPAWIVDWTFEMLAEHRVGICAVEGEWIPRTLLLDALENEPGPPVYVRFMGERNLDRFDRVVRPEDELIRHWFERLEGSGRRSFVYFSNLFEGFAPASANKLRELAGQSLIDPATLDTQRRLF